MGSSLVYWRRPPCKYVDADYSIPLLCQRINRYDYGNRVQVRKGDTVRVREVATGEDAREWEDYVLRTETAVLYHDLRWREYLKRVYGLKTLYLLAEHQGRTVGVLPMALVKGLKGGLQVVSSPYHMYGGVCADSP